MILEQTTEQIQDFIYNNKICVVTNSKCMPGTTFLASMRTYLDYVPTHNFMVIPGYNTKNHTPYYGEEAFSYMIVTLYEKKFDYAIYIDDDCFISNMSALIEEFKKFMNSGKCLAGVQDGTVICHRNHSQIFVNAFISFWNIKNLKINKFLEERNKLVNFTFNYEEFKHDINPELYQELKSNAKESTIRIKEYRDNTYKKEVPYASIVRNDPNNPVEPHQIPYSTDDNRTKSNAEPYYATEQAMVIATGKPIYYMFGTDLYNPSEEAEETNIDNSGLTSVVMTSAEHIPFAYHTWFSRMYTKWPQSQVQLYHTKRINSIIKNI